jgi:hypothetical protein
MIALKVNLNDTNSFIVIVEDYIEEDEGQTDD